jgi:ABC-type multidrug transport system fused ATPase/permease subunit
MPSGRATKRRAAAGFLDRMRFLRVSWRRMALLGVLSVIAGFAQATVLLLIVRAAGQLAGDDQLDGSIGPLDLDGLSTGEVLTAAAALVVGWLAVELVAARLSALLVTITQRRLRADVLHHFTEATWAVQQQERRGELDQLLTANVNQSAAIVAAATAGLAAAASFAALFVSALVIDPVSSLLVVGGLGALLLCVRPLSSRARKLGQQNTAANRAFGALVSEHVSLLKELRAFGVAEQSTARLEVVADDYADINYRARFLSRTSAAVFRVAALLLVIGILLLVNVIGSSDLLGLTTVVLLLVRSLSYGQVVQSSYHLVNESAGWAEELQHRDQRYRSHRDATPARTEGRDVGPGTVAIEEVSFTYGDDRPALRNVTVSIANGEMLGIVGPSGAGKTTLVELLLRLRRPTSGVILADGIPLDDVPLALWRERVTYVPQEPNLLRSSVGDNVRFYRSGIDDHAVARALALAGIADEVGRWPAGVDTLVGELGTGVSGGQRQRIALARALVTNPRVVILDEPTSSLDGRSEALISETLQRLRGETTLVIVAHRLSTLTACDRIMVLEAGEVTGLGTPTELAEQSAFYREVKELSAS